MTDHHEPPEALSEADRNLHRALASLKEEIEAVDWYHQRWALCGDEALRRVIAHNRDEEVEHAAMTLEWIRRQVPAWDAILRAVLFREGEITEAEAAAEATEVPGAVRPPAVPASRDLGIGSLKGAK